MTTVRNNNTMNKHDEIKEIQLVILNGGTDYKGVTLPVSQKDWY